MFKSVSGYIDGQLWSKWITVLEKVAESAYHEVWFTGEQGTGKSTAAIFGALYDLYKLEKEVKDLPILKSQLPLLFVFSCDMTRSIFDEIASKLFENLSDWLETKTIKHASQLMGRRVCGAILGVSIKHRNTKDWITIKDGCKYRILTSVGDKGRIWFDASDETVKKEPALEAFREMAEASPNGLVVRSDRSFRHS